MCVIIILRLRIVNRKLRLNHAIEQSYHLRGQWEDMELAKILGNVPPRESAELAHRCTGSSVGAA